MQVRLTATQLSERAGLPKGSLGFYIASGLLEPSVHRAGRKGQPNIFGFRDLVIAMSISQMRLPSIAIEPMKRIAAFWRSDQGAQLLGTIGAAVDAEREIGVQKVFLLLADGRMEEMDENARILDLTRRYKSPVIHVLDAGLLGENATIDTTEALMRLELVEPGPGGRLPRTKKMQPTDAAHEGRADRSEGAKKKTAKKLSVRGTPGRDTAKKSRKQKRTKR